MNKKDFIKEKLILTLRNDLPCFVIEMKDKTFGVYFEQKNQTIKQTTTLEELKKDHTITDIFFWYKSKQSAYKINENRKIIDYLVKYSF